MTEKQAWIKVSNAMQEVIDGGVYDYNINSICEEIDDLFEYTHERLHARMSDKIHNKALTMKKCTYNYLWSHSKRWFEARKRFCLKMAKQCKG